MKAAAILLAVIVGVASGFSGFLAGCYTASEPRKVITPFWGAATRLPGAEIITVYEEATDVEVEATWGGAGQLLSAMVISKSGDLYLGVGTPYDMEMAIEKGAVDPATVRILAYLVPVILVPEGNPKNITCLENLVKPDIKLSLTNPDYGVGLFVKKLLEYNGLWEEVDGRFVEAESGEKAVSYVILGNVDATVSWHVFYYWNPDKVDIVWISPEKIPEVSFIPAAVSVYTEDRKASEVFLDFVSTSETAKKIFDKYGYVATLKQATKYTPYSENTWQRWMEKAERVKVSLFQNLGER
ncbi:substrate-binding domain-containing protein [Candidatus Hecatella orcuttiae]|jgi:molybdate transport system substrate-binding protein|uniref:substrate-binding domain-containing protein n=1 Tax=Candidatus Hecatella orcuttiae TaxID=1935119 RepID=UPI002867CA23|nr:substrate-binding domain-containing protein [Candidatus Hecatella orcuttiae]